MRRLVVSTSCALAVVVVSFVIAEVAALSSVVPLSMLSFIVLEPAVMIAYPLRGFAGTYVYPVVALLLWSSIIYAAMSLAQTLTARRRPARGFE